MSDIVYIGLGSNVGEREHTLFRALDALSRIDAAAVLRCSSLYDSAPVGQHPQARFLNAVVELECVLPPQRLLAILQEIERELGRKKRGRWQEREIDLDILLWDEQVIADPNLQIPHLELHKRRFALEPLCELSPELSHPVTGDRLRSLLRKCGRQDVVRLEGYELWGNIPMALAR